MADIKEVITRVSIDRKDFDENGHLNNEAYPRYFEEGRLALVKEFRIDTDPLKAINVSFLVRRAAYDYIKSIESEGEVEIHSRFLEYGGRARIQMHQEIFFNGQLTTAADLDYFFFDLVRKKPIRPPGDIIEMLFPEYPKSS